MKKILFIAAALLAMVGCKSKDEVQLPDIDVAFKVVGLYVSQEPIDGPNKAAMSDKAPTHLTIFEGTDKDPIYSGESFEPTVKLTRGEHTLTFVATYQSNPTYSNGVWSADKCEDTYGAVVNIDTKNVDETVYVELMRVNYGLTWSLSNKVNNDLCTAKLEIKTFRNTLVAGLAGGTEVVKVFDNIALKANENISVTANAYCATYGTEESIETTLTITNEKGKVLATHTMTVPVLSNRKTVISGDILNVTAPNKVTVQYSWLDDYEVPLQPTEN